MDHAPTIARHFREAHHGGNLTGVNMRDALEGITWQQATTQIASFNTISALVFHINYYVDAVLSVLEGGPLDAHDKFSFDVPPIRSAEDWQRLLDKFWRDADRFAVLVEQMPDERLWEGFAGGKYGTWYRNLHGLIEHMHYHMGQIVLIRKMAGRVEVKGE